MNKQLSQKNTAKKQGKNPPSIVENSRILTEVTKRDIEKSYKLETLDTEVHYSNRYGWTLRKTTV